MNSRQLDEERIFHTARLLPNKDAQADYLEQVCAGDQALRERVEALLDIHEKEKTFLKSTGGPPPTFDQSSVTEQPGQMIGRYKLLQKIGEGGFGVVYMAEQIRPIRRKVALKIIKPGMDTQVVIARFEAERQALALMDHPNIARVLDGGATETGRPYFVMELVKGVPITEYCDANRVATEERLELFVGVCEAVQHAHQKGIIHRDLKPSNVLITLHDGQPVIKVIDFGVAKAINQQLTEKTLFTAYGQMVGTPQYMSPEQAEMSGLDVDTRSDIYSLGVVLFELLTGTTPLEVERLRTAGYVELQRLIRDVEPPKPSTRLSSSGKQLTIIAKHRSLSPEQLQKTVKGDLDWIVMKALEKDRSRRYATSAALAADIRRFLNDQPVEACPPSSSYRLQKFIRRNRTPLATSSLIVVILIAATIISSWLAYEMKVARDEAKNTLASFRRTVYEQGKNYILNAEEGKAEHILDQLRKDPGAARFADRLEAILCLHQFRFSRAIEILNKFVGDDEGDTGARAMLTDAYDGNGDIHNFYASFEELDDLDKSKLSGIELIYAAFAYIIYPKTGYELANEALKERPTSHYARLVRGRMGANYANRKGMDVETNGASLLAQAIADVESLKLLYAFDNRIPIQSLATYLFVANTQRQVGDDSWQETLGMAEHVAKFLEKKGPTNWERFFLAEYIYVQAESAEEYKRAWRMLEALSNEGHDWGTNHYLAMCFEIGEPPNNEVLERTTTNPEAVFGLHAAGCWYALNDQADLAITYADRLAAIESVDAIILAVEVAQLAKRPQDAKRYIENSIDRVRGDDFITSARWLRENTFEFYVRELLGEEGVDADTMLMNAKSSEHASLSLSTAHWHLGLRKWCDGKPGFEANFKHCVDQHQFEFTHHAWSRAIAKRYASDGK